MDFSEDPRRVAIEPMHVFMETWAYWGRFRPMRYESMTYKIMCWLEDHNNKAVKEEREKAERGESSRIRERPEECELIAWKVEHYLVRLGKEGRRESQQILRTYYLECGGGCSCHEIARKLHCKTYKIDDVVKDALFQLSLIWRD